MRDKLEVFGSVTARAAATQDAVKLSGRAGGTTSLAVTITPTTLTASRTVTLPDADLTVVGTTTTQTLTNKTVTGRSLGQNTGVTLTAAQVAGGFVYSTPTANITLTSPTGTDLDTAIGTTTDAWVDLTVFTTAAFSITLGVNTGVTIQGSAATAATANSFARFRFRRTGTTATWIAYRIS